MLSVGELVGVTSDRLSWVAGDNATATIATGHRILKVREWNRAGLKNAAIHTFSRSSSLRSSVSLATDNHSKTNLGLCIQLTQPSRHPG